MDFTKTGQEKKCSLPSVFLFFFLLLLPTLLMAQKDTSAADADSGAVIEPLWRMAVAGTVVDAPSAQAGSVVVVLDGSMVKAYSWQGTLLWEYFAAGKLCPFVSRSWDGTSYICRTNGYLYALNRTGKELWRENLKAPVITPIVPGWDGRIFAQTANAVFCFNKEGKRLWMRPLSHSISIPPTLDKNGGLLFTLEGNVLVQISAFGKITKTNLAGSPAALVSMGNTASHEDFAPTDSARAASALVWYTDGSCEKISADKNGAFIAGPFPTSMIAPLKASEHAGEIAALLPDSRLIMLSKNGEMLWEADTGIRGAASDSVAISNEARGVYAFSRSRAVAFRRDGTLKWAVNIDKAASLPAFGAEGVLYSGGLDWILYAYRLEYTEPQRDALYSASPQGNYGLGKLPAQRANYYDKFSGFDLSRQLASIRREIGKGDVGENEPVFIEYLKEAASSMRNSLSIPESMPPVHARERVEAARLLASFGSQELVPFFADLFLRDKDPGVKAAAAEAIGRIGVDPEGAAMEAFSHTVKPPLVSRDERVLIAVAAAIGSLCRVSGPPMLAPGVPILAGLAAADKPQAARERALKELNLLRSPRQ